MGFLRVLEPIISLLLSPFGDGMAQILPAPMNHPKTKSGIPRAQ